MRDRTYGFQICALRPGESRSAADVATLTLALVVGFFHVSSLIRSRAAGEYPVSAASPVSHGCAPREDRGAARRADGDADIRPADLYRSGREGSVLHKRLPEVGLASRH